ncbi:putative globin-like protein aq_211 [Clavelina lepadiformis]|uniref:putative globin-like protein aq_211 n=1 Tax=Clavelina lepadiformis TaxID=159417 RepID=UPI004043133D
MTLTNEQLQLVGDSWKELKPVGMKEFGLLIYHGLFNDAPQVRYLFQQLNVPQDGEITAEDLRNNPKMIGLAMKTASSIAKFVENVEDDEEVEKMTTHLGKFHAKINVKPEHFEHLAPVLLKIIGKHFNLPENSPTLQAWAQAYGILKDGIVSHYP